MSNQITLTRQGVARTALVRQVFPGLNDGMNASVACCDRWVEDRRAGFIWQAANGEQTTRDFAALRDDAARFANLLTARGVGAGDVVAAILPRGAALLTVILGTWRAGAVFQPMSPRLSPLALDARINHTGGAAAKLIVTDSANRGKLDLIDFCPPVLVVTDGADAEPGDGDFAAEMTRQFACFAPVARGAEDAFLLLVGGNGGRSSPVRATLGSLLPLSGAIQLGLEPTETTVGWDAADPAWAAELYFSVLRPLLQGEAVIAHETDRAGPVVITTPPHLVARNAMRTPAPFRPATGFRLAA